MPTTPRLYIDTPLADGAALPLGADQAHYLVTVLRKGAGDSVEVFNAEAGAYEATVVEAGKRKAVLRVGPQRRAPEPDWPLTLYFSPIKRGPMEVLIQKATELGVTALRPVTTARTVAKGFNRARLHAIAVEAAEQCERLSVPDLGDPEPLAGALAACASPLLFADESGDDPQARWGGAAGRAAPLLQVLHAEAPRFANGAAVLIGPEGGFTPEERTLLRARKNTFPVSLGPLILRAETAALTALAVIGAAVRSD